MTTQYPDNDDEYIQQIKYIKESKTADIEAFDQAMNFWRRNIPVNLLNVISRDKICKIELVREENIQECATESINQIKHDTADLEQAHAHLRDLENQEMALKEKIQNISNQIDKLKHSKGGDSKSNTKEKLERYRNIVKFSKRFTGTKFDYQAPNITGVIINKENLHPFELNAAEVNEQGAAKYLWKYLEQASAADWSDIFSSETMELS